MFKLHEIWSVDSQQNRRNDCRQMSYILNLKFTKFDFAPDPPLPQIPQLGLSGASAKGREEESGADLVLTRGGSCLLALRANGRPWFSQINWTCVTFLWQGSCCSQGWLFVLILVNSFKFLLVKL